MLESLIVTLLLCMIISGSFQDQKSDDEGFSPVFSRFVKHLLSLKERYPDRVHLIIGNRDSNKLRLAVSAVSSLVDMCTSKTPHYLGVMQAT
jgi:hypothetical protein